MTLRGVGGKIADCVLLFAYGFDGAFPWTSGSNARCANFISTPPRQRQNGFSTLPRRISARTPVTRSNIFFITCDEIKIAFS